jgi:enamine deaminase RidA (YjgF/YER057c/UK114 family)
MAWRLITAAVVACCLLAVADCPAAEETAEPSVRYFALDAPAGMSQAVVVDGLPLVYTRQLLPLDNEGKLLGEGSADKQIEQVLDNLASVLDAAGSGLGKLVRLNVYALSHKAADRTRELLSKRLGPGVRPAITTVLTPLPHRKAVVAVDALAVATEKGQTVALERCEALAGDKDCADAAVLPPGGVVYLSGQPEKGALAMSAVTKSLSTLLERLAQLQLSPAHVVQLKVFLTPASSADEVLDEMKRLFPDQLTPPVVFVEWTASAPVEIELVAQLPSTGTPAETVELYNPPDVKPSPTFSRAALVRSARQIFISGLSSRDTGDGEAQARDVFAQLKAILAETGGDMLHLAKATYYVSDDEASKALDRARLEWFDSQRAPAASKVTVHGVGQPGRTLTTDMIVVGGPQR